jgi:hypothetical protein
MENYCLVGWKNVLYFALKMMLITNRENLGFWLENFE